MRSWELKGQGRYWLLHINSLAVLFQNLKIHADTEKGNPKPSKESSALKESFLCFSAIFHLFSQDVASMLSLKILDLVLLTCV